MSSPIALPETTRGLTTPTPVSKPASGQQPTPFAEVLSQVSRERSESSRTAPRRPQGEEAPQAAETIAPQATRLTPARAKDRLAPRGTPVASAATAHLTTPSKPRPPAECPVASARVASGDPETGPLVPSPLDKPVASEDPEAAGPNDTPDGSPAPEGVLSGFADDTAAGQAAASSETEGAEPVVQTAALALDVGSAAHVEPHPTAPTTHEVPSAPALPAPAVDAGSLTPAASPAGLEATTTPPAPSGKRGDAGAGTGAATRRAVPATPSSSPQTAGDAAARGSAPSGPRTDDAQQVVGEPAAAGMPSPVPLAPDTTGVNALTPVIPSTTTTATAAAAQSDLARTEAITNMVSAANQAIIQRVATGDVEVPDLGRISVKAAAVDGRVDIDVASDRAETRAVLHASAGALVADLRQADIAVGQLRLAGDAGSMTSDRSPRDPGSNDTPRRQPPLDSDRDEQPAEVRPVATVRIVL